jgi:hypothetical protein
MRINRCFGRAGRDRALLVGWGGVIAGVLSLLFLSGTAVGQSQTTFSGQATVVRASVPVIGNVVLADTGPLAPEGGAADATLLEASVPGLLSAEVLHAAAVAGGSQSNAEASVANLDLTVVGNHISAGFLMARAQAQCRDGRASVSGSSQIFVLNVNGQEIAVTGEANQTIALPVGRLIINEQIVSADANGKCADMTVNALHVVVPGIADVVIASAHADICCGAPPTCDKDFVTGGGWITGTPTGAKGTFGVAGGIRKNSFWGHLTYIDHGAALKVKGTGVTSYTAVGPTSRRITGTCEINGQPGTYDVTVSDNGEPGRNDTFSILLSTGYSAAGNLEGGNIQLHLCR